jgi:hypothetical protein
MRTVGRSRETDNPAIRQAMNGTVANWPRIGPAAYRTMTQEDGLRGEAISQVDCHPIASPQVAESSREPSQGGVVVRGDSCWRGRRQRTNLIRQPPLMQATPPHPPSCTGDGGRHDVREDPFPRSAISTRSSLAPEDRPLLRIDRRRRTAAGDGAPYAPSRPRIPLVSSAPAALPTHETDVAPWRLTGFATAGPGATESSRAPARED